MQNSIEINWESPVCFAICTMHSLELMFQIDYLCESILDSMLARSRTQPQRDSAFSNKWFLHLNNRFSLRALEDGMKTKLSEKN